MGAYESFARVYDLFMDNVPYEEWGSYLTGLLRDYGICRICFRELAYKGQIPGVKKASW